LLYQFSGEYSSFQPQIVYFSANHRPKIFKPDIPIPHNSICALLSQNKIIPYEIYVLPTSHQELLILRDNEGDQFFVTFQKSKDQFINIARSREVLKNEFPDYVECIWEAYNLQGWKKNYWKIKSFFTMTYAKYLIYMVTIFSCLGSRLLDLFQIVSDHLEIMENYNSPCVQVFVRVFCNCPFVFICIGAAYIFFYLCYYGILLPFFILVFLLKYFVLEFNSYSFFYAESFASFYIFLFPQIKQFMPYVFSLEQIETIERFIEPKDIMSSVPLLFQKKGTTCWTECLHTIMFCCLMFLFNFQWFQFFWITGSIFLMGGFNFDVYF